MNDRFRFRVWSDLDKKFIPFHTEDLENCPECGYFTEQCTGLKDKNGKLIYEGDIVKRIDKYDSESYAVLLQVEWNNKGGRYITTDKDHDTWTFSYSDYEYEVIGNIHENPELLEGK